MPDIEETIDVQPGRRHVRRDRAVESLRLRTRSKKELERDAIQICGDRRSKTCRTLYGHCAPGQKNGGACQKSPYKRCFGRMKSRPSSRVVPLPARLIATAFGAGYRPVGPGTVGTLFAIPLGWALAHFAWPLYVLSTAAVTAVGVWASDVFVRATAQEDDRAHRHR